MEDLRSAVTALLWGKASVDQLARGYGMKSETIEGWREKAAANHEVRAPGEDTRGRPPFVALKVAAMSRQTSRGEAPMA